MIRLIRFLDRFAVIPISGNGHYLQQPVYVEDVAKSIVNILFNEDTIQNEFNISGRFPHTYNEIIDLTAKALGKKVVKIHMPFRPSLYAIKLYEKFASKPLVSSEQIMRLNENKNFDHSAAKKAFGYNPVSFGKGIKKEVELYRQSKNQ
jgi:nucleoside-diphosphate-sugar epimerase